MRALAWCVVAACAALAAACSSSASKRPARGGAPRAPQPPPRLNVTFPTYECEPHYRAYYCLNGGACFTVLIADSTIYNCECRGGFVGPRCEFKDLDHSYVLSGHRLLVETAGVAGGAAAAVLLACAACAGAWLRLRRKPAPPAARGPVLPVALPAP